MQPPSKMTIIDGHLRWSSSMVIFDGHLRWSSSMVILDGHLRWSSSMVIFDGHLRWRLHVSTKEAYEKIIDFDLCIFCKPRPNMYSFWQNGQNDLSSYVFF